MESVQDCSRPKISLVVIAYQMARQLRNTLYSLSASHQQNINANDYEVIVVENRSGDAAGQGVIEGLAGDFHYYLRDESSQSPVNAVNFALSKCRGEFVGLIIDGARMLTPGVLNNVLLAVRFSKKAVIAVPGYHLGSAEQAHDRAAGDDVDAEQGKLRDLMWQENGYRIFNMACFSSGNRHGYFDPIMECSALFCNLSVLKAAGGADQRFDLCGGGAINLHLYRQMGLAPQSRLFVLPGEGSFHQFHGGVTTSGFDKGVDKSEGNSSDERALMLKQFSDQLNSIWEGGFKALSREPVMLGAISAEAQAFLQLSSSSASVRFKNLAGANRKFWQDDECFESLTQQGN